MKDKNVALIQNIKEELWILGLSDGRRKIKDIVSG
jgi:hypothetical protein